MRYSIASAAILASASFVAADLCALGSEEVEGNWYCQAVDALVYSNVGTGGTYNQVTNMGSDGSCPTTPISYSGAIKPLDEGLSAHFRGPLALKKFAVYTPASSSSKKEKRAEEHARRHAHAHQHLHKKAAEPEPELAVEERDGHPTIWVTATIDGAVVSWVNNYWGPSTAAEATATAAAAAANVVEAVVHTTATSTSAKATSTAVAASGSYERVAYYDSVSQTAEGLVFLANLGGAGSGVFDTTWGNSLSYVNAAGDACASSSTILADTTLASDQEVIIMSDELCTDGDDTCGYYREGIPAYKGFAGADKIFLVEYQMPHSGGSDVWTNDDMSAFWLLNSKIPRTCQYCACSCWASGCAEFDVMEVLSPGLDYCKSTFHMNQAGGSSDYIARPVDAPQKYAVIFDSASQSVTVKTIDNSTSFDTTIDPSQLQTISSVSSIAEDLLSLFTLS